MTPATSRPRPIEARPFRSEFVWLALVAYLTLVKALVTLSPAAFRSADQAAVFDWPFLAFWLAAGLIGIWFARRTGFPEALDARVSNRQRFLVPALLGLGLSALFVALDRLTGFTAFQAALHGQPRANIDFPASALIYPGGAVIVEVFYRLLLIPLLLWLISNVALRGRGGAPVFWTLAVLTSLVEPLTQDLGLSAFSVPVMAAVMGLNFSHNLAQAALFRKYGFLAAIVMRISFYVVWHMLYVH